MDKSSAGFRVRVRMSVMGRVVEKVMDKE